MTCRIRDDLFYGDLRNFRGTDRTEVRLEYTFRLNYKYRYVSFNRSDNVVKVVWHGDTVEEYHFDTLSLLQIASIDALMHHRETVADTIHSKALKR